jgi:diphosphomevalonate decarboxylase
MNIMSLEKALNPEMTDDYFYQKASFLSKIRFWKCLQKHKRNVVVWGKHKKLKEVPIYLALNFHQKFMIISKIIKTLFY